MSEKLQPDWLTAVAKRFSPKILEIAGRKVFVVSQSDENLLIAQITDNTLCVANHIGFLSEVLQLTNSKEKQAAISIAQDHQFQDALSCISPSAKFWGIRRFAPVNDTKDPTSIYNTESYFGFRDSKVVFLALELPKVESDDVQFYYASEDAAVANGGFQKYLGQSIKVTSSETTSPTTPGMRKSKYVIARMKLDLTKKIVAGMDEPGVLFLTICVPFGQGMLL